MSQLSVSSFRPIEGLTLSGSAPDRVHFRGADTTMEIGVLADDLFRVRIARDKTPAQRPSWAVSKTNWPSVHTNIAVGQHGVGISTKAAKWRSDLVRGSWEFSGASERIMAHLSDDRGGSLQLSSARGAFASEVKTWRIVLHEVNELRRLSANGADIATEFDFANRQLIVNVANQMEPIEIKWRWA